MFSWFMSVSLLFGCSINSYSTCSGEAKWLIKFYMLFVCNKPLLQQERSSQGLQVKSGLCKAGVGTHMETRIPRVDAAIGSGSPTREPPAGGPCPKPKFNGRSQEPPLLIFQWGTLSGYLPTV